MNDEARLSPRSSVLSPVSKLHKLREMQAEAQQRRVDAFSEKQRRWKKPSSKPTIEIARRIYPQKQVEKPIFHFRRTYARESAAQEKKNVRMNEDTHGENVQVDATANQHQSTEAMNGHRRTTRKLHLESWEEVQAKAHAVAAKRAELLRSQQLLEEIEKLLYEYLHAIGCKSCTTQAIDDAARYGHFDIIKLLHQNRTEGWTSAALYYAIDFDRLDIVKYLAQYAI
ncbi:hypothetical protein THRCLA_20796 [Thraustotheca clavata]|uniref:Uncharacterized protein n=1 Tax=Thraustotheca clavata TaxID=74557 RepID=A0A1W0A3C7_9STRA|nr:hypothetical protein THRCLA_20796 [Thraustotheca clavata]